MADKLDAAYDIETYTQEDILRRDYEIDRLQNRLQECYYYRGEVAEDMFLGPGVLYSTSILGIFLGVFFIFLGIVYWGGATLYHKYKDTKTAQISLKPQYDEYMEKITILNILKENSKTTREDIKNITNFDESEIDQVIKDLVEEERIVDFGNKFQIR